jgi:hypothetical protein
MLLKLQKRNDAEPDTGKFDFMLHLREWGATAPPQHMQDTYNVKFHASENLLRSQENSQYAI